METGRSRPRKLDYVHFTRVNNSSSPTVTTTMSGSSPNDVNLPTTSMNILTKFQMMSPHLIVKVIAATIFIAAIIAMAVTIAFIVEGKQPNSKFTKSFDNLTTVPVMDNTSSLSSSVSDWILSTATSSISTSSSTFVAVASPLPSCTDDQFRCPSGQCVSKSAICNEVYECADKGDEANCSDCTGFRCLSNNVCLWDRMTSRCNQIFDCEDYSDELNCPRKPRQHVCSNGVHILSTNVCDGLDDCGDNSDEETCVCQERKQFPCSDQKGKCIPITWVCDGNPDCPNGADEDSCDVCTEEDFRCTDYSCVNKSLRCDGKVDCSGPGGDEDGCVELTALGELRVMVAGNMLPVCSDGWTDGHSTWACNTLHARAVLSWTSQSQPSSVNQFAVIKDLQSEVKLVNFDISEACLSKASIHIICQNEECGRRQTDVIQSFVAGGNLASLGKWPWVLSLAFLNKPICGAALIGTRWALTAAHCIMYPMEGDKDYSKTPSYFTVTAGAVVATDQITNTAGSRDGSHGTKSQIVRISKIIFHPKRIVLDSGGVDWDLALLQLVSDITMTDFVQPVCLPSQTQIFPPTSICYLAGWGLLSHRQYIRPSHLRDTRMQLWSESRCSSNTVVGETVVNTNSTLCAGYLFGRPTGCQGDSGGPLTCLDSFSGRYFLAGIMSQGSDRCGLSHPNTHGNRFVRVAKAVPWIQEMMRG